MRSLHTAGWFVVACLLAAPAAAQQNQITGGSCTAANLSGVYALTLSGRGISATGAFAGAMQLVGTATFDGTSAVTFNGVGNSNLAAGSSFHSTGSYVVPNNCSGTIILASGITATFTLVVWNNGADFAVTASNGTYIYSGSGNSVRPAVCGTPTLSGEYMFSASGSTLSGTNQTGTADEAGVFQFDGQGHVTASYSEVISGAAPVAITATGTYSVTSACLGSATFVDSNGVTNTVNLALTGNYGATADLIIANPQFIRSGSAHAAFLNPAQSIGNVFSYALNSTPPGSVFVLFGTNLATRAASAATVPFPTKLLNTTVTVNGTAAPLYYVSPTQINAIMPWETPGGALASAVVTNGTTTSNAAAVYVPATGTPGIAVYGSNHAVVTNSDGITVNSASAPANVGDEVVAWFTGGGPVNAASTLKTGGPAPSGLSPITGSYYVTVGTAVATVKYIGLTPGSIGLYQVNFIVPQLAKGSYPVQIVIAGQASNAPVMAVGN
jgi:uncharacterized protein (TIGR03437 family)